MPPHEIRALQERRFLEQVARAWRVPFYQKHWSKAGLAVGDIHCLDDIEKIPPYTVHDLRESIERNPPWGDYWGGLAQRWREDAAGAANERRHDRIAATDDLCAA
jgi:phenylacetate-CoA ligase